MERRAVKVSVVCAAIVLIIFSICQADGQDDLNAAFAAAPPGVRELQCRDVASLSGVDLGQLPQMVRTRDDSGYSCRYELGRNLQPIPWRLCAEPKFVGHRGCAGTPKTFGRNDNAARRRKVSLHSRSPVGED